jgi:hypothetical protein
MKPAMSSLALLISANFGVLPLLGQPALNVADLMTAGQYQKCGLHKLTDSERAALNAWVTGFAHRILEMTAANASAAADLDFSNLEGAVIVADDGQFLGKITTNTLDSQSLLPELCTSRQRVARLTP